MTENYLYSFRIVLIGEAAVGKSCLMRRFVEDKYDEVAPTLGMDLRTKAVTVDRHKIKLQIWDTAGMEKFRSITRSYLRIAAGILLVFNISDRLSFRQIPNWLDDIKLVTGEEPVIVLVGSQVDKKYRQVGRTEAEEFANEKGMEYIETSAKTGQNVDALFTTITKEIFTRVKNGTIDVGNGWNGVIKGDTSGRKCCQML